MLPFFQRVIDSFFRHWLLFVISVVGVTVVATGLLVLKSKGYVATAKTRLVKQDVSAVLGPTPGAVNTASQAEQNSERFEDLMGDDREGGFLDTALKAAKLDDPLTGKKGYSLLRRNLIVEAASSSVFTISLTWPRAADCERIVKSLQNQYIEDFVERKQDKTAASESFLDSQIEKYERRMRQAEQVLIQYRQANFGQSPESGEAEIRQLATLRTELSNLRISTQENDLKSRALKSRLAQIQPTSTFEQTVADDPMARQLKELQLQRAQLLSQYKPESDEVKEVDAKIAALTSVSQGQQTPANANRNVVETKQRANPEYTTVTQELAALSISKKTQTARASDLERQIQQYEAHVRSLPQAQRLLNDRMRDYNILKSQYENLLVRREQARITGNLDRVSARSEISPIGVVSAERTTNHFKLAIMGLASLMVGVVVGSVLLVLREWSDVSLRYGEDVERLLAVPALVSIPETSEILLALPSSHESGAMKPLPGA